MAKQCFRCGLKKSLSQFYRHPRMADGHLNKCKACAKIDVSKNYRVNIDHYVNYERARAKLPKRKELRLKTQQKRRLLRPGRYRAANAVSNAIRDGRLMRLACEICGGTAQAHHDDYRKPLDVRWLCRAHHLAVHGKVSRE